ESETAHHYGEGPPRADEHRLAEFPASFDLVLGCPAESQRPAGVCFEPGPVLFRNGVYRGKELPLSLALRLEDCGSLWFAQRGLPVGPKPIMSVVHFDKSPSARRCG